jgi:hypothetical protein
LRYTFQTLIFHSACTRRLHYWGFILPLLTWTPPVGMNRHPYWVTVVTFHTGDINFMLCRQTPPSIRQHPCFVLRSFRFHASASKAVTLHHDFRGLPQRSYKFPYVTSTSQEFRAVFFHFQWLLCSNLYAFAVGVQCAVFYLSDQIQHAKQTTEMRCVCYAIKGKSIPLQVCRSPEGSRRLRLPDSETVGT